MSCKGSSVISGLLRRSLNVLCLAFCGIALPLPACAFLLPHSVTVYEYLNENIGHYLLLSDPNEIAGVDAGAAGAGGAAPAIFSKPTSVAKFPMFAGFTHPSPTPTFLRPM